MIYIREITKDLIKYLVDGEINGETVAQFDQGVFPSDFISGKSYQFVTKQEHADSITNDNIIPVLLITLSDKQKDGEVMYNGRLTDTKTLLITDKANTKISFFVVPYETNTTGNHLGTLNYTIDVDYNSDIDVYGYIAKEISTLIKMMYQKPRSGDYHNIEVGENNKKLFFVPSGITNITDRNSILGRIKHTISVKGCNFA